MKKIRSAIWSIIVLLLISTGSGQAAQILAMPTADAVQAGSLQLDYAYHRGRHTVRLELGLHPQFSAGVQQEIGGKLSAAVKAVLAEETEEWPALALGGEFSAGRQDLYAVLSKQLGAPHVRGHLAWGLGRYSRGMAGVTVMLNPVKVSDVPTTSLFLEYDGIGLSGGLQAQFSPELGVDLGVALGRGLSAGIHYRLDF